MCESMRTKKPSLYAPLLPARTRTSSTKLLRLHPPGIRNQQRSVISNQELLQLQRARRIVVLGIVRNDRLGNRLTDSIHLRSVSTALYAHADINGLEFVLADDKDGLVDFVAEDLGLDEVDGGAIDTEETTTITSVGDRCCGLTRRG